MMRLTLALCLLLSLFAGGSMLPDEASASSAAVADARPDFSDWYSGYAGMEKAIREQRSTGKPMLVYFYTDWCPYCRQFETDLLAEDEVTDYLDDVLKVRINPEAGVEEQHVSSMYRVTGYPTLIMHSGASNTMSRVNRMVQEREGVRLMTGDEFVRELARAATL
jgi:thiol:disulfide interchange protein